VTRIDSKGGESRPKPSKPPRFGGFAEQFAGQISIDHPLAPTRNGECIPEGRVGLDKPVYVNSAYAKKGEAKLNPEDLRRQQSLMATAVWLHCGQPGTAQ